MDKPLEIKLEMFLHIAQELLDIYGECYKGDKTVFISQGDDKFHTCTIAVGDTEKSA